MPLSDYNKRRRIFHHFYRIAVITLCVWGVFADIYAQTVQSPLDKLPPQKGCEGNGATLDVSSERMTYDGKNRAFIFENKVRVIRCTMTITCDHLQVIRSEKGNNIERIIATRNVQFQQGTRSGVADRADYFEADQKLVLTGSPRIWDTQDHNELNGDEIVVMLQEERVVVKQARVLFRPRNTTLKTP